MKLALPLLLVLLAGCSARASAGRDVPAACATNSRGDVVCQLEDGARRVIVVWGADGTVQAFALDSADRVTNLRSRP